MDLLLTIYRSFILSWKWTLRMFTNSIDVACVTYWLEYKQQGTTLGVEKKIFRNSLHQLTTAFYTLWLIMQNLLKHIFFTITCSCKMEFIVIWDIPKRTYTSCLISCHVAHSMNVFWNHIRLLLEFCKRIVNGLSRWFFITNCRISPFLKS